MGRAVGVSGFVLTFLSALVPAGGAGAPQIVPNNTPIVSLTIDVSSPGPTMTVGQTRSVSGTVNLNDGQSRVVGSGSLWQIAFGPAIPVSNCGTTAASFSSQVISIDSTGAFNESWSPGTPNTLIATGTISMPLAAAGSTIAASLRCGNNAATGSLAGSWTGPHYTGTYDFNGVTNGAIAVVGVTWSSSNPAVATVNQFGQVTALAPGDTTITGTYGSACWQMTPDASGCIGTTVGTVAMHVDAAGGGGGGGGEEGCATIKFSLTADSVSMTSVEVMGTLDGQSFGPFPVPIGQVIDTDPGEYQVQFTAPDGYSVTPEQTQFTLACGDARDVPLKFTEVPPAPTIDTVITQAQAMGLSPDLLKNARARLLAGNVTASCNQIGAFMQYVGAQSGKYVSEADAAALIGTIAALRTSLNCR